MLQRTRLAAASSADGGTLRAIGSLGVFLAVALFVAGVHGAWFWDDLHMIRDYSSHDLVWIWHHTFDPNQIETRGYRPLETLVDSGVYRLFGESATGIHLLFLAVTAVGYWLIACALRGIDVPYIVTIPATVLTFTAQNFSYTLNWNTAGYQSVQLVFVGGSLLAVARALDPTAARRVKLLATSFLFYCLALLTKDSGILLLPVIVGFGFFASAGRVDASRSSGGPYRQLVRVLALEIRRWRRDAALRNYVIALTLASGLDYALRTLFVPHTDPMQLGALLTNIKQQVNYMILLAGPEHMRVLYYSLALGSVIVVLIGPCVSVSLRSLQFMKLWYIGLWALGATAVSNAFVVFYSRSNLVEFPLYFYGLVVCITVAFLLRSMGGYAAARWLALTIVAAAAVWSLGLSIRASRMIRDAMSSHSIQSLVYDYDFLYGSQASQVTVPTATRGRIEQLLGAAGIRGKITNPEAERDCYEGIRGECGAFAVLYCAAKSQGSSRASSPVLLSKAVADAMRWGVPLEVAAEESGVKYAWQDDGWGAPWSVSKPCADN